MASPFNQNEQGIESKIVVALERVSEAFRVLLWNESKENSLSPIQIQLLVFIHFHSEPLCKVSYLAHEFNMTKATISDSVRVLLNKKLVSKQTDPNDTRSYSLSLTQEGKKIAEKSALFTNSLQKPIDKLSENQKHTMLNGLLKLINDLNNSEVISVQRMCFNCNNYERASGKHFCKLLNSPLSESELRIDCAEHEVMV
jgi:DNA-binding MarR family transcriptional regulator